jgi:signal transduction histidine kinase
LPEGLTVYPTLGIGTKRYENTIEIVMYRVFGELVHNTVQHAEASRIDCRLYEADGCLMLEYHDDGVGFDPKNHLEESRPGLGYFNMVSRVSSLKGEVIFGDQTSNGTFVTVIIPLK